MAVVSSSLVVCQIGDTLDVGSSHSSIDPYVNRE